MVGFVCLSNGLDKSARIRVKELTHVLEELGLSVKLGECLYQSLSLSESRKQKADDLMRMYDDRQIEAVFDLSGGDLANDVLDLLDYEMIKKQDILLWGYSDLTCVLNAIYTMTSKPSVLYSIHNLIRKDALIQRRRFRAAWYHLEDDLFSFPYTFLQGHELSGIVVGGNIRCFLKLAGTRYFPDLKGKILLLEAYRGDAYRLRAYFASLRQIGAFDQIAGLILGTFTEYEQDHAQVYELIKDNLPDDLPVVKAPIGHGSDAYGIIIGKTIALKKHEKTL
ncbi:MAG: LD-carboxypeptidase [bacterium]